MALSSVDTRNALAAQIAKNVFQVPTVVCRMDDPDLKTLYNELDIVAISATTLATQQIMEAATA
jgi:trk system potassium uptake protein TrkA